MWTYFKMIHVVVDLGLAMGWKETEGKRAIAQR